MTAKQTWTLVFLGAAVGAASRVGLGSLWQGAAIPWAYVLINLWGAFALAVLYGGLAGEGGQVLAAKHQQALRLAVGTGFMGGFTTYSSFMLQVFKLPAHLAFSYALGSLVAGLVVAVVGYRLGRTLRWRYAAALVSATVLLVGAMSLPKMSTLLALSTLGAAGVGALGRWKLGDWVNSKIHTPITLGTTIVNLVACTLMGAVSGASANANWPWLAVITTGFLGGLSTFSTASVEGGSLVLAGKTRWALTHQAGMALSCFAALALAYTLTN